VQGTPVSLSASRMSVVARAMAESAWEGVPESPVADMRESNGSYDILFALPDNMDPESVKSSTSGNVLTLYVSAAGTKAATFVKRFYIPCGAARVGVIETSVSNDLVRVRVRQPGG
jgi:HSP20 family molecular chaperone IbpA